MVRIFAALFAVAVLTAGYVATPFWAAWSLREAIKANDKETVERMVIWDRVRASLKLSLLGNAELLPEAAEAAERIKPTMWQRVKTALGQSMVDRFIESYVTPEGLPKLLKYRKTWNGTVKRQIVDEDDGNFFERAKRFYARMVRAEFQSLTRVEIEMEDNNTPERRIVSVMELHGIEWKLAELRLVSIKPVTASQKAVKQLIGLN